MNPQFVVESVKHRIEAARSTVGMVASHGQTVVHTGGQTLQSAKDIVVKAGRDAIDLAGRTRTELVRTLKDGATQMAGQLSRIATPTHKEMAEARKVEIKEKKARKRAQAAAEAEAAGESDAPAYAEQAATP